MTTIQVNGVELEYVDEGTGVPVVFSHGGHSDLHYWDPQLATFSARYRFVTYSRRNHGFSAQPEDGDNSVEAHVADLLEILRSLDAGPVHLVGFSTNHALRAALQVPGLVRSLTIIEPNVPWLLEGYPEGESALAWWRTENERVRAEAAGDVGRAAKLWFELVNNRGPGTFDSQPVGLRQMWRNNYGRKRPGSPPPQPLTCAMLRTINTPTLAIQTEYGMPYSRQIVARMAKCIPNCRLVTIPDATHFMSYQQPTAFNQVVLDFLSHN